MENITTWRLMVIGFWLGVGFIIPSIATYILGTAAIYRVMPSLMSYEDLSSDVVSSGDVSGYISQYDKTSEVELLPHKASTSNGQLLIIGKVKNNSESSVGSVQLEAELFDQEGNMVYECSEYISSKISSGNMENYQIKCGCGKNPVPEYSSLKVRVTKASTY